MKYVSRWISAVSISVLICSCAEPFVGALSGDDDVDLSDRTALIPPFDGKTLAIPLSLPAEFSNEGGIIAADVTGDSQMEFLITQPDYIAVYSLTDGALWSQAADIWLTDDTAGKGLPGPNGPGIQASDVDNDGLVEVLYVTEDNQLKVLSGASGELKYSVDLPPVDSAFGHWEQAIIANFSGEGDYDILLQASQPTDKEDYARDNIQAAYRFEDLLLSDRGAKPLWLSSDFVSLSHGGAKVVDLDGDGKDEVVGATVLGSDGQIRHSIDIRNTAFPHIDSVAIGDIVPENPGLEVVMPEENGKERVFLFDEAQTIWVSPHREKSFDDDGDKVAIGDFDPERSGLEMWFRGNDSAHFTVLDVAGDVIADYEFRDRKPEVWTEKGFEMINRIRWSGDDKEYIAVKERHEAGDVGIFDAMTGQMILHLPAQTQRLYVVDVLGDWREEIVILENDAINVYENMQPNPNPNRPRLWTQAEYRRQKMTWDYYSP